MRRYLPVALLTSTLALPLAACDHSDTNNSTEISIHAEDEDGNTTISSKGGSFAIKAPGFEGSIKIPGLNLQGGDVDLDGVHLPANSRVTAVDARSSDKNGDKSGQGTIRFESDLSPAAARTWFTDQFSKNGFKVQASGDSFSGTTGKGNPFKLDLTAKGNGSAGTFAVKGNG